MGRDREGRGLRMGACSWNPGPQRHRILKAGPMLLLKKKQNNFPMVLTMLYISRGIVLLRDVGKTLDLLIKIRVLPPGPSEFQVTQVWAEVAMQFGHLTK